MNYIIKNTKETLVFKYFEEISAIPRCSGNEKGVADYLVEFAKANNLWYNRDDINNVIIKKQASLDKESSPIVILQGHTDMVCEKDKETTHNFDTDPLTLKTDGEFLFADKTTLGADNGVAVAYMLAILSDNTLSHPALECIFTVGEEVGFDGAYGLDTSLINGKTMINLDSEEEGIAMISCAGGGRIGLKKDLEYSDTLSEEYLQLSVLGLVGGHSGLDIKFVRINANMLLGRLLYMLNKKISMSLVSFNGGSKDNAIPREANAIIGIKKLDFEQAHEIVEAFIRQIKKEYSFTEKGLKITAENVFGSYKEISSECTNEILSAFMLLPNGIQLLDSEFNDFVVSSINLGVVKTENNFIDFTFAPRSSLTSAMEIIKEKIMLVGDLCRFNFTMNSEYPGWERSESSKIRDIFSKTYKNLFNKELECKAIHAGLECGLWAEKITGLDAIAIGPNIYDCHTPKERLDIASCDRTFKLLKAVLEKL